MAAPATEMDLTEARIADLVSRGLAPAARLSDIRRSNVLASTRLLDLEESLATALFEFERLQREEVQYDQIRMEELLAEREEEGEALRIALHRLETIAEYLGSQSSEFLSDELYGAIDLQVIAHRRDNGEMTKVVIPLDSELQPADTLEVTFSTGEELSQ